MSHKNEEDDNKLDTPSINKLEEMLDEIEQNENDKHPLSSFDYIEYLKKIDNEYNTEQCTSPSSIPAKSPKFQNKSNSHSSSYHTLFDRAYLEKLSKSELIDIIIEMQHQQRQRKHHHQKKRKHRKELMKETGIHRKSKTLPFHKKTFNNNKKPTNHSKNHANHPHETLVHRRKPQERMATNYEKIKKQRVMIKALKEERKKQKEMATDTVSSPHQEIWIDPHEKTIKGIKATERMATNYDLIEKRRADIKALKKSRKREKLQNKNSIKWRRERAQQKMLGLFNHAHEQSFKSSFNFHHKRKLRKSRLTLKRVRFDGTNSDKPSKGKIRILRDDEILRFSEEIPIDNFLNAINSGFVKIMNEEEQNEEYMKVTESAKKMLEGDVCNYQFVVSEYNDSSSDWDDDDDDDENDENDQILYEEDEDENNEDEKEEEDEDELLQKELLLLNIKTLKRKCKEKRLSAQGGKLELIQKIIQKKHEEENVDED